MSPLPYPPNSARRLFAHASGGDGYPKITTHSGFVDTGFVDAEVLKAYLEQQSPVNAADYDDKGEITYK